MKKGERVTVYEDPITETKPEGNAVLVREEADGAYRSSKGWVRYWLVRWLNVELGDPETSWRWVLDRNSPRTTLHVSSIQHLQEDQPGRLLGVIHILGTLFHADFIRVKVVDGLQVAHNPEMAESLDAWLAATQPDGHAHTVNIPGYEGDWLLFIHPGS